MQNESVKRYSIAALILLTLSITALLATWTLMAQPGADAKKSNSLRKQVRALQTQVSALSTRLASAERTVSTHTTSINTLNTFRTCARTQRAVYSWDGYGFDNDGNNTVDTFTTALDTQAGGALVGYLTVSNC